jgi:hypothetical protein
MVSKQASMKTKAISLALGCVLAAPVAGRAAESLHPLWQIGQADHRAAEFALSPTNYPAFLQQFGSPDRAYYVGISKPEPDEVAGGQVKNVFAVDGRIKTPVEVFQRFQAAKIGGLGAAFHQPLLAHQQALQACLDRMARQKSKARRQQLGQRLRREPAPAR